MKITKRLLSGLVAVVMIIGMLPAGAFAVEGSDYENSWAKNEINYMKGKGILSGYPDGTFRPDNNMTKAEFYKVTNELIGYTEKVKVDFMDVKEDDWFYEDIQKAVKAGYAEDTKVLNPNEFIKRQEVARILSVVFNVEENKEAAKKFADYNSITADLRGVLGGLVKEGYLTGYPDNTVRPEGLIKRSEIVKVLHSFAGEIVNTPGIYVTDANKNMLVNTDEVILKNIVVEGNLYLTEGIGDGDVVLDNVEVKGTLSIKGGGENSIIIRNSKLSQVAIDRSEGKIRVVFENTSAENVTASNEVKLELKDGTEIKIVELDGKIEVLVEKGSAIVTLDVLSKEIVIEAKGNIDKLNAKENLVINDKTVKKGEDVKVAGGKLDAKAPTTTTPPATSGGGGGGGSTGGGGSSGGGNTNPPTPALKDIAIEYSNSIMFLDGNNRNAKQLHLDPSDADLTFVSKNPDIVEIVDAKKGIMKPKSLGRAEIQVTASKTGHKTRTISFYAEVIEEVIGETEITKVRVFKDRIALILQGETGINDWNRIVMKHTIYNGDEVIAELEVKKNGNIGGYNELYVIGVEELPEGYNEKEVVTSVSIDGKEPVLSDKYTAGQQEEYVMAGSVKIQSDKTTIKVGETLKLEAIVTPEDTTYKYVGWSIIQSDENNNHFTEYLPIIPGEETGGLTKELKAKSAGTIKLKAHVYLTGGINVEDTIEITIEEEDTTQEPEENVATLDADLNNGTTKLTINFTNEINLEEVPRIDDLVSFTVAIDKDGKTATFETMETLNQALGTEGTINWETVSIKISDDKKSILITIDETAEFISKEVLTALDGDGNEEYRITLNVKEDFFTGLKATIADNSPNQLKILFKLEGDKVTAKFVSIDNKSEAKGVASLVTDLTNTTSAAITITFTEPVSYEDDITIDDLVSFTIKGLGGEVPTETINSAIGSLNKGTIDWGKVRITLSDDKKSLEIVLGDGIAPKDLIEALDSTEQGGNNDGEYRITLNVKEDFFKKQLNNIIDDASPKQLKILFKVEGNYVTAVFASIDNKAE